MSAVRQLFRVNYYRWALDEFRRELDTGFPLVQRVNHPAASTAIRYLQDLPPERARLAVSAMVKRFHKEAISLLSEPVTREDAFELESLDAERLRALSRLPIGTRAVSGAAPELRNAGRIISGAELEAVCGSRVKWDRGHWRYDLRTGDWRVETFLTVDLARKDVFYSHALKPAEGDEPVATGISLLAWLGISGETAWNIETPADIELVGPALRQLCSHFINALPSLLSA